MSEATFDNCGTSTEMLDLIRDVLSNEYWVSLLRKMENILDDFDHGTVEELDIDTIGDGKIRSIVRYCIPLFEMHRAIDGVEPDPAWLAAMYLWQEAWRPLDNLLDHEGQFTVNFREYNVAILRAWTFHSKIAPNSDFMEQFLECLYDTIDVESDNEKRSDPSFIYRRARLYEVTFSSIPGLSSATRASFRTYINTVTIAHDFGDVATDIKQGSPTFVTAALECIDPNHRLTSSHYKKLQASCVKAFLGQKRMLDSDVLRSCWVTQRNIDSFFRWAFHN